MMGRIKKYYLGIVGMLIVALFLPYTAYGSTFPGGSGAIVYVQTSADGRQAIWKVNPDGSGKTMLVDNAVSPTWSPNGQKIAYIAKKVLGDRLYTMNADGTNRTMLTYALLSSERSPAWSYDGSQVAIARDIKGLDGVVKMSGIVAVKSSGFVEKSVSGWSFDARFDSPSWSPNNHELVYEKDTGEQRQLHIKNLHSGTERLVTTLSDDVDSHAAWSPSGAKILYNDTASEMYTIWPDGTHRATIADGESFAGAWSPDGTKIAFLEDKAGSEISVSEADGTVVTLPVAKDSYRGIDVPLWSPDGSQLVFTLVYADANTHVSDLFVVSLENTLAKTVVATGNISQVDWQAIK
jgi:Tol biopolymer transport system component